MNGWPLAVIFDMDGLMFDSERVEREAWQAASAASGYTYTEALHRSLVGRRDIDSESDILAYFGADFPLEKIKQAASLNWEKWVAKLGMPMKPGLLELLDYLESESLPKAVATSTIQRRALLTLGALANRFDAVVFGDEIARGKPEPDIFLLAAERLGVPPGDCLALEDSPAGVAAAESAGITVALVPDLVEPQHRPRYVFQSLLQVIEMLRTIRA